MDFIKQAKGAFRNTMGKGAVQMEGAGARFVIAPHILESGRSAWRLSAADSSCLSSPYGGGDGKLRGQEKGGWDWGWDEDIQGDLVIIWHSSAPFITLGNASHVGAEGRWRCHGEGVGEVPVDLSGIEVLKAPSPYFCSPRLFWALTCDKHTWFDYKTTIKAFNLDDGSCVCKMGTRRIQTCNNEQSKE